MKLMDALTVAAINIKLDGKTMTDNSPLYFSYISKAELAHLRKSHAALRGWTARYRREIEGLVVENKRILNYAECANHALGEELKLRKALEQRLLWATTLIKSRRWPAGEPLERGE